MRMLRALVAGLFAALALLVCSALPASAHDQLVTSSPKPGERLDSAPQQVSLTFSDGVLSIGAEVIVVDETGEDWVVGDPDIEERTVTVALAPGMPEAGYEIRWRVVSSDGHPVSGLVPFTIGAGTPFTKDGSSGTSTTTGNDAAPRNTSEDAGALRTVVIGMIGAAAALAVFATFQYLTRRARRGAADPHTSDAADRDII